MGTLGSPNTYWLRGAVLPSARICRDCGVTFDSGEVYSEGDINELKDSYPETRFAKLITSSIVVYEKGGAAP